MGVSFRCALTPLSKRGNFGRLSARFNYSSSYEIHQIIFTDNLGRFLPIALRADTILGETTIYSRREALYRAADGLECVYGTTLERIRRQRGSKSRLGIAVLMSLSHAGQALHVDELRRSLAIDKEGNDLNIKKVPSIHTLLGSCFGLITFDSETSTVRLAHITGTEPQGNTPGLY